MNEALFFNHLTEHLENFENLRQIEPAVSNAAGILVDTIRNQNRIFICGNGGSAADAQHFAAELTGRFEQERVSLPAIALTTDTSALTAIGNDYGFEKAFSRQLEGLGRMGDALIAISTSGNSPNIREAVRAAKSMGIQTIGLLGKDGGLLASEVDRAVTIPHPRTARIQEAHIFILHYWAYCIEGALNTAHR